MMFQRAGLAVIAVTVALTGCTPTPAPSEEPVPTERALPTVWTVGFSEEGLYRGTAAEPQQTALVAGNVRIENRMATPDGSATLFAWSRGDSTGVLRIDHATGQAMPLHATPGRHAVTLAFSGTMLAIGYQRNPGGGIFQLDWTNPAPQSVGCSASDRVLSWRGTASLIVGNASNVYQVSASGCGTEGRMSRDKRPDIIPSADGERIAYLERDLVYNRASRSYAPETTLYVGSRLSDSEARAWMAGDKAPRDPVWSAAEQTLAFTFSDPNADGRRRLLYLDASAGELYQVPGVSRYADPVEDNPIWSPDGSSLAYERVYASAQVAQIVVKHLSVAEPKVAYEGADRLKLVGWASNTFLRAVDEDGHEVLLHVDGTTTIRAEAPGIQLIPTR